MVPKEPKLYHIVHVDRLASIISDQGLWCDARMVQRAISGTMIGMSTIKHRRLGLALSSHPTLTVGECVPFYFCPRSIMLFLIHRANHPELTYRDGQSPIVHLELDLSAVVSWLRLNGRRWAFTLSNAGSNYFEDRSELAQLSQINWDAVQATKWAGGNVSPLVQHDKQAEFLVEDAVPWSLVERIGVQNHASAQSVSKVLASADHRPLVQVMRSWYY